MIEKSELKVMEINSTIFQAPTTNLLCPESPRRGYYEKAGFVAMKLAKANSSNIGIRNNSNGTLEV
jgi:hypothetical protein